MDVLIGADWESFAVRATTAFTVAVVILGMLRRPWRHLFGAEAPYSLWLALPPALAMAWLPAHAPWGIASATTHLRDAAEPLLHGVDVPLASHTAAAYLFIAWLMGTAAVALRFAFAQWRYARGLRGAYALPAHQGIPVLRATGAQTGPAQLGAFRPRIVLPADFATRFTAEQQYLVIEHEATHARRNDCAWNVLAHAIVTVFWFHPLAWWALRAFRADQELACDASVIGRYPQSRRIYAEALLKNHVSTSLP